MDGLRNNMGRYWQPFLDYSLLTFINPEKKSAAKGIMNVMIEKIPGDELKNIEVPVTLIWGRHDKANKLKIAVDASKKYNWPLHIIEDARDDPKLEKPDVFVQIIETSVADSAEKRNILKTVSY